ncbi:glycosyltransferase family 39 protein [candidate division WOR-3 bacterium]|nr:glycosyltransferase family 39 protein [candidate division WOR-3 bacterium]
MNNSTREHTYLKHIIVLTLFLFCIITIWRSSLIDWDEGVFALQGQWFASFGSQGKPFNFQTPPLFQLIIAFIFALTGQQWYILPLLSVLFACSTLYVIHGLTSQHYSEKVALLAMVFTASTELFIFFARSGLSDATFLFLFTSAIYFFLQGVQKNRIREFLIAGILTAAALYTKYSALPLLVSFAIIGSVNRKSIPRRWFFASILLPILLYLPYVLIYAFVVQIPTIAARHGPLMGIHHLSYVHYGLVFAPVIFLMAIIHLVTGKERKEVAHVAVFGAVYFFFVGFYHPYMRLLLPIIPLCAILAARLAARTKKLTIAVATIAVLCGLFLSYRTIRYNSEVPRTVAERTTRMCREQQCHLLYASVPPNIAVYLPGNILIPEDHAWITIGRRFPCLMRDRIIMERSTNILDQQSTQVYLHGTIYDSLRNKHTRLFFRMSHVWTTEFIDAPLYCKDPYNPLKNTTQAYELYTITPDTINQILDDLWQFGFEPAVTVLEQ